MEDFMYLIDYLTSLKEWDLLYRIKELGFYQANHQIASKW